LDLLVSEAVRCCGENSLMTSFFVRYSGVFLVIDDLE
jgi:hypothetical protein